MNDPAKEALCPIHPTLLSDGWDTMTLNMPVHEESSEASAFAFPNFRISEYSPAILKKGAVIPNAVRDLWLLFGCIQCSQDRVECHRCASTAISHISWRAEATRSISASQTAFKACVSAQMEGARRVYGKIQLRPARVARTISGDCEGHLPRERTEGLEKSKEDRAH